MKTATTTTEHTTMTDAPAEPEWLVRMRQDMKLRDFRARTQEAYENAARLLARHFGRSPEELTEEDLRAYFLHLRETRKLAPSTLNVQVYGIRFLYWQTFGRQWPLFNLLHVHKPKTLPVVLSTTEVRALLGAVRHPMRRMALTTIYALGLRLNEALDLEVCHLDSARLHVWIRNGKGAVDRGVPLPRPLLLRLRHYWKEERPKIDSPLLFVTDDGPGPIHESTLQKTFSAARTDLGLLKGATIHTLRHSYATHLLEAGISLRTIQAVLGHKSLRTTEVYLHVTQPGTDRLQETLDRLMSDL